MRNRRTASTLSLLLALTAISLRPAAARDSGSTAADFLNIPAGGAPAALAGAYTARAADVYAPLYNPAGLGRLASPALAGQHLSYLQSIAYEAVSLVAPLQRGADGEAHSGLGLSILYLGTGDIPGVAPDGTSLADFSGHYAAYGLSYGRRFGSRLSLGLSGRHIESKLAETRAQAWAVDVGGLYRLSPDWSAAVALLHLGERLRFLSAQEELPRALRTGLAGRIGRRLALSVDGVARAQDRWSAHGGAELTPAPFIALRAGYRTDTAEDLGASAGFTAGIGLQAFGQEFSYAWTSYGDLGDSHAFSLLLRWGAAAQGRTNLQAPGAGEAIP